MHPSKISKPDYVQRKSKEHSWTFTDFWVSCQTEGTKLQASIKLYSSNQNAGIRHPNMNKNPEFLVTQTRCHTVWKKKWKATCSLPGLDEDQRPNLTLDSTVRTQESDAGFWKTTPRQIMESPRSFFSFADDFLSLSLSLCFPAPRFWSLCPAQALPLALSISSFLPSPSLGLSLPIF